MTSTNFSIGMAESRNSSRVLKPPGGGHSDIFGTSNSQEPVSARRQFPKSTMSDVFGSAPAPTPASAPAPAPAPAPTPVNNVTNSKTDHGIEVQKVPQVVAEIEPAKSMPTENGASKSVPTPQRTRVPPGGFSSGLW